MKQKKTIYILILILTIGIVGLTIAYFANSSTITNTFNTNPYGTTVTEEFVSPDNWLPGTSTDKSLTVTNSGQVDEAVRISYTESWTSKSAKNNDEEGDLPLSQNGNTAALIHFTNTDDWTTVTENGTTYRYYNYKLEPNQTTSELLDYVTFNPAITNSSNCVENITATGKTITCNSTGTGYDDATYKLVFSIETIQYDKYKEAWGTNVNIASIKPMNASQLALKSNPASVTNYTDVNVHEMYTFNHEATEQTPALTDYRYIGHDPYNYVYFNCESLDNQSEETCEVWRILGVFDVAKEIDDEVNLGEKKTITETRIKLVRENLIKKDKWDETGKNDWTTSTLNLFLNGEYYSNTGESLANGYGLKELAREMIDNAIYYLGASNTTYGTPENIYSWERGANLCGACGSDITKLKWEGKIAIMYPSDEYMIFKGGLCHNTPSDCRSYHAETGWIYNGNKLSTDNTQTSKWLLSPTIYYGRAFYVTEDDTLVNGSFVGGKGIYDTGIRGIRPTLYLSSSVKIINGNGSRSNPYWLSL